MPKISLLKNICLLIALSVSPLSATTNPPAGAPNGKLDAAVPLLQINTSIIEARGNHVLLEINWYIEQDNFAIRPTEASIIAILIGARGREYKVSANVSIE